MPTDPSDPDAPAFDAIANPTRRRHRGQSRVRSQEPVSRPIWRQPPTPVDQQQLRGVQQRQPEYRLRAADRLFLASHLFTPADPSATPRPTTPSRRTDHLARLPGHGRARSVRLRRDNPANAADALDHRHSRAATGASRHSRHRQAQPGYSPGEGGPTGAPAGDVMPAATPPATAPRAVGYGGDIAGGPGTGFGTGTGPASGGYGRPGRLRHRRLRHRRSAARAALAAARRGRAAGLRRRRGGGRRRRYGGGGVSGSGEMARRWRPVAAAGK